MARLSLALLGPLEVRLDGQAVMALAYDKVWALLAYLAIEADRPHRRDALVGLLWPDQPDQAARTNLRQALTQLRQALGDHTAHSPFLLIARESIQFNCASDYDLDVTAFQALLAACDSHPHRHQESCTSCVRRCAEAGALYRGSFLAEFFLDDATAFEEWALLKREELHHRALGAFAHLTAYHARRGDYERTRRYARRQLELDPWREEAHRQLMRVFALTGQRSAALQQYETCHRILADGLGVEPEAETTALYEQIKRGDGRVARGVEKPPTNLHEHTPLSTFVGREAELAHLADYLERRDCRLLTLGGPGGVGKTRLAQQVALELRDSFSDGIWFVPLATISDSTLVVRSIAGMFGITETPGQPLLMHLKRYLGPKELLLVLDNFEQVINAGPLITELLASAPHLTVMITSRAVLRLSGEQEFDVPPLALPDRRHLPAPDHLTHYEAVRLLIERAQAVKPGFVVTHQNASAVAEICYRLDGLPLAIELAAVRVKLFSPQALLTRLNNGLNFLTGGARDLPARQQTIRNTIAWSYHLLEEEEKIVFARMAVFVGGCTLEAVEAVCNAESDLLTEVVDAITALVDKSLLRRVEGLGDEPHFTMLETIREYALEQLRGRGEDRFLGDRHCDWFLQLAETAEQDLQGPEQMISLDRVAMEHDNLRAGLFTRPHGLTLARDERHGEILYCVDDDGHWIGKFSLDGELLMSIGRRGEAAPRGSGQPFNRPTKVALDPRSGELYISGGYGNARVHKYSADGQHLFSWGDFGVEPGQFNLPHSVCTDRQGRVYVADRENHRVQIFDDQGRYLEQWNNLHRPCGLHIAGDTVYIGQLPTHLDVNADYPNLGACVTIHDLTGRCLARLGDTRRGERAGQFTAPHGIAVDSRGDLYVGEVSWSAYGSRLNPPRTMRSFRKLVKQPGSRP